VVLTMSGDTGVLTLLDVGLGLQTDGNAPAVRLIVKRDLQGPGRTGQGRVSLGSPEHPQTPKTDSLSIPNQPPPPHTPLSQCSPDCPEQAGGTQEPYESPDHWGALTRTLKV
jgi:hypothetical protein